MPFVRSKNPIMSRVLADELLGALGARPAAALLATPTVHLCNNSPTINPLSAVGIFTETAFTGYAAIALPALVGPVSLDGTTEGVHAEVDFAAGSPVTVTDTITGYYVTDTTGAILYQSELFEEAIPVVNPGDFISLDVVFPLSEEAAVP